MTPSTPITSPSDTRTNGAIPIRNLWYMLLYVWDAYHLRQRWDLELEASPTLDALFALVLTKLVKQRLRIGLGRDYKEHGAPLAGIRGRIDFARSLNGLSFEHARAWCRFDIFSADVPRNQIVRSTLARLASVGDFGPDRLNGDSLRGDLRRLVRCLGGINVVELRSDQVRRERTRRIDLDYSMMLAICQLILQRQMPAEKSGTTKVAGFDRELLVLSRVYERFIAKFYATHLSEWRVDSQIKLSWPTDGTSEYMPMLSPDLTLFHKTSKKLIVLDTKFTGNILVSGRWGGATFDRNHIFQIYAYLRSQEQRSPSHAYATGVLLFPTANHRLSETIRLQGHVIRWETIDLSQPWQAIESDLLKIPAGVISAA